MTVHDVAAALPDVSTLRELCLSIAVSEAAVNPRGEYRYYSFDAGWSETEEVFSMRNGGGDEFDVVFSPAGVYIRGFDHESRMSPYAEDTVWPGVLDSVPEVFRECVDEPAWVDDGVPTVTCCVWREAGDDRWRAGRIEFPAGVSDPDGSQWLFSLLLDPRPEAFQSFAEDYYERAVDVEAVRHIYGHRELTPDVAERLQPGASGVPGGPFAGLVKEAARMGYPVVPRTGAAL
ncbi:hypothetical protein ACFY93_07515 [Streptomyces sp. NPDC008313]|uniref:hypothetical protein n=1 Tax=Streptomyces sp. NPDC008313 TaxID=3364826 RepID=UPI0036F0EE6F